MNALFSVLPTVTDLPDKAASIDGVGVAEGVIVAEGVGVTSSWLFCSVSGEERREEAAALSMEDELERAGAVTVEEEPEEEEEIDLGRGSAGAGGAAGVGGGSEEGVSISIAPSAETSVGSCAWECASEVADVPSGRAAVPGESNQTLSFIFKIKFRIHAVPLRIQRTAGGTAGRLVVTR